jgi:hypothetical protein
MISWAVVRVLARQPVQMQRSVGNLWLSWTLLALAFAVPACGLLFGLSRQSLAAIEAVPVGALAILWWAVLLHTASRINTPANVRLHPHLRQSLAALVVAYMAASSALLAGTVAVGTGHFLACLIITFVYMAAIAATVCGAYLVGVPAMFAPVLLMWGGERDDGVLARLLLSGGPALGIGMLGACLFAWYALARALPGGGEHHWRTYLRAEQLRVQYLKSQQLSDAGLGQGLYGRILRRDCARSPGQGAMMLHALGPALHWSRHLGALVLLSVTAPAMVVWMHWRAPADGVFLGRVIGFAVVLLGMLAQALLTQFVAVRMAATRTEQAVVRLAVRAPQGAQLNRALAVSLLRRGAWCWLWANAFVLGFALLLGPSGDFVLMLLSLSCAVLPPMAGVLRDYAALRNPLALDGYHWVMGAAVALVAGFCAVRYWYAALPWPVLALLCVGLAALVIGRRWRAMVDAPQAFPAQRFQ